MASACFACGICLFFFFLFLFIMFTELEGQAGTKLKVAWVPVDVVVQEVVVVCVEVASKVRTGVWEQVATVST